MVIKTYRVYDSRVLTFSPSASTIPRALAFSATEQIKLFPNPNHSHSKKMVGTTYKWVVSEMDKTKMKALVVAEKILKKEFVKLIEATGQHWLSGEIG